MFIYNIKRLTILMILISNLSMAIEIDNISKALDISGKQRMFTQKMLKDYAMIGMKNTFGNPKEDLKNIIEEFEDHQLSLISFIKDKNLNLNVSNIKKLWKETKSILLDKVEKSNVKILQENLNKLLIQADSVTKYFVSQTKKSSGDIIDISGRQRMLSQKMASLYMLKVWGFDDIEFSKKLNNSISLFKQSKEKLKKSSMNTDKINKLLSDVDKSFMFFEMMAKSKSKFIPSLIYRKSNDILRDMNIVTRLYVIENNK